MSRKPSIIAFAGSAREGSFNKKLIRVAAAGAEAAGADVEVLDLRDFPLPLYDGDSEAQEGVPANAEILRKKMAACDGLLISAPEYNSSITPLLKNTIDWVTRLPGGKPSLEAFQGKLVVIMSASPGGFGGMRGLVHLRAILGNVGAIVLPQTRSVRDAFKAFDESGRLVDDKEQESIEKLGMDLAHMAGKMLTP
ncbi:NADPH-dependent FMN reductase [Candidatus Entotheonella palauensis]|uniref:FMN reductase n=1 Tax=Candidatus Entotheonella gemina TaxID=1429439 RepID=W4M8G0_9BACT|nr:NAD(P)H-dependent oxidoreductase [Candidatus Entotheonella palauensis]ETX06468.1 MAG: FMN reductase [Candidatus Entotheonella gemina]